jgi:hypothetical protein
MPICIQSLEKTLKRAKHFFSKIFNMGIKKQKTLILNVLKKFLKNAHKKVIRKNVTEIRTFFMLVKLVLH